MTEAERFQFTSTDGLAIARVKWSSHHQVPGVVQIAHGLSEHMGRYAELVEKLVDADFDDLFLLDNWLAIVRST